MARKEHIAKPSEEPLRPTVTLRHLRWLRDLQFRRHSGVIWETIFVTVIIFIGFLESLVLGHHNGWHSIFDAGFGFGELARSLREHGEYRACYGDGTGFWDYFWGHICFHAHRLPFIPIFLASISFISVNPLFGLIFKNVIFFTTSALAFVQVRRTFGTPWPVLLVSACIFYLNPINAWVAAGLEFEEGYIYHILPWIFFVLATPAPKKWQIAVLALALVVLILLKSSLFYLCITCIILLIFLEKRNIWKFYPAAICLFMAIIGWGAFTLQTSGRFAFGSDMSSNNGWNLYKGNNVYTADFYPNIHLDYLDNAGITKLPGTFHNEWDLNDRYKELALAFMVGNPLQTAKNISTRLYVMFISTNNIENKIPGQSIFVLHIILVLTIIYSIIAFFVNTKIRRLCIVYITVLLAYLLPYISGFAYQRHMVPACGIALFFAMAAWGVIASSKRDLTNSTRRSIPRARG
jgi:hypothetical protein